MCGFLMLLLEQHVVIFTSINLLVVHAETNQPQSSCSGTSPSACMVRRDEINNQLHNIVVIVVGEAVL
jgi:hypothetical protein